MLYRGSPVRPNLLPRTGLLSASRPSRNSESSTAGGKRPLWLRGQCAGQACPICSDPGPHRLVLSIPSLITPDRLVTFLRCRRCESKFVADFAPASYETAALSEESLRFYVEQGAGLEFFARALCAAARPHVRRYLEIGCGFGFGLDIASRMFGWDALGLDPGPMAAAGREMLGVNIESGSLTAGKQLSGAPFDVIVALEVIEHVVNPRDLVNDMANNLSETGTLVLSTPDARYVDTCPDGDMILPTLSPGHHAVLFTAEALSELLRKYRFPFVTVMQLGSTLLALASRSGGLGSGLRDLDPTRYLAYLQSRFQNFESGSPIHIGIGSRLLACLVNRENYPAALDIFSQLDDAMAARFNLHLADPLAIAGDVLEKRTSFAEIPGKYPFSLAGLLYQRGRIAAAFENRADFACSYFLAARFVAQSILTSLNDIGINDGELALLPKLAAHAFRSLMS